LDNAEFQQFLTTLKFREPSKGQVKGIDTDGTLDEKLVLLAKPAVVRIFAKSCGTVTINRTAQLPVTSGKSYKVCSAGVGSGFFVNSDGYVGTNGHVVVKSDYEIVYNSIYHGYSLELLVNIFRDYYEDAVLAQLAEQKTSLTSQEIVNFLVAKPQVRDEIAKGIATTIQKNNININAESELYVQKGNAPFETSKTGDLANATDHYKATLVDSDYKPGDNFAQETSSDVAILKVIKSGDYPAMSLAGNASVNIGSSILVMGFPGVATDTNLVNTASKGEETVTRGIVSAIKETTGGRKLIQTDTSIQNGSSGGPAINRDSQVIGLATYGLNDTGGADYNFLRDINDLAKLMTKNKITNELGSTESKWREGVNLFFEGKFSAAVKALEAAQKSNSDLGEADNLISIANSKIAQGLDKPVEEENVPAVQAFFNKLSETEKILLLGVCCMLLLVFFLFFVILIVVRRSSRRNAQVVATATT
jgi:S1-C subfamily serine protease